MIRGHRWKDACHAGGFVRIDRVAITVLDSCVSMPVREMHTCCRGVYLMGPGTNRREVGRQAGTEGALSAHEPMAGEASTAATGRRPAEGLLQYQPTATLRRSHVCPRHVLLVMHINSR